MSGAAEPVPGMMVVGSARGSCQPCGREEWLTSGRAGSATCRPSGRHHIATRALDLVGLGVAICGYEVWTPLPHVDFVWPIDEHVERKLEAIRSHRSQLDRFRLDAGAEGMAACRGALLGGCRYAEAFACVESQVAKP